MGEAVGQAMPSLVAGGVMEPYRRLSVLSANGVAGRRRTEATLHGIIYLVGLVVVILAILSFFGLR